MSLRESGIDHETLRALEESEWARKNPDKAVYCPRHTDVLMVPGYRDPTKYRCRCCPKDKRYTVRPA